MLELHDRFPAYGFAEHKGYITDAHSAALDEHGPCPEHRMRFVNVARARDAHATRAPAVSSRAGMDDDGRADVPTPHVPSTHVRSTDVPALTSQH